MRAADSVSCALVAGKTFHPFRLSSMLGEAAGSGEVAIVRCADVGQRLRALQAATDPVSERRVVACLWSELPRVAEMLDAAIDRLAEAAFALWPAWQGRAQQGEAEERTAAQSVARVGEGPAAAARRKLLGAWLAAAARCCAAGRPPRPRGFPRAVEVEQLALAIGPAGLDLCLCLTASEAPPERLYGLARAAEWLAASSAARVFVFLPAALPAWAELDSISFRTVWLEPEPPPARQAVEEKDRLLVWPFQGRPHPASPGERRLAARLAADAELAGLFQFNQSVRGARGRQFTVDLLWAEGRLVVEVDGYRWHGPRDAFAADRQRDFELVLGGYLVLRLTHDEVMEEIETAVGKVRDLVAFRRRHPETIVSGGS